MANRGKIVILVILAVGVGAATFSVWYHYRDQHRALDFWGPTSALLIAEAPQVEILRLGEPGPPSSQDDLDAPADSDGARPATIESAEHSWKILSSKEAPKAPGISNVRRALVLDSTFDWQTPPGNDDPDWQYAVGFNDGRHWATVLFDFESRRVALTGSRKTALLDPAAAGEWREFFVEQFADELDRQENDQSAPPADGAPTTGASPADQPAGPPADPPGEADPAENKS